MAGADRPRVLAVASKGGHWEQLRLLRPALADADVRYATTDPALAERDGLADIGILPEANGDHPFAALVALACAVRLVARFRPDVVVSTGALPGLLCIAVGRLAGARTIWIDSVANSERLSRSGRWARYLATRVVTQWEHLSGPRVEFGGRVL